jgi:hypothetical protein
MKKLALVIAIAMISACFVVPAMASELKTSGQYRALAIYEDPGTGEEAQYFRQRFRAQFKWLVNDNVSATLRGDFAEMTWGDYYRPNQGVDTLMVDYAFVTVKSNIFTFNVGQQAGSWAHGTLWSDQFQGIMADVDLKPVGLRFLYEKRSEGGVSTDVTTDDGNNDDDDIYGAGIDYKAGAFDTGLSWARLDQSSNGLDNTIDGYSLYVTVPFGKAVLKAEITMFDGDDGATTDYKGTQAFVSFDSPITEAFKAGIMGLWADDVDDDEVQVTNIADDAGFNPIDFAGHLGYDRGVYSGYRGYAANGNPIFTGASTDIFDISGAGKGVLGVVANAQFMATKELILYAKLAYAEPNDDDTLESRFFALGNVDYMWMPGVVVSAGVAYIDSDYSDSRNDDPVVEGLFRLGVNF